MPKKTEFFFNPLNDKETRYEVYRNDFLIGHMAKSKKIWVWEFCHLMTKQKSKGGHTIKGEAQRQMVFAYYNIDHHIKEKHRKSLNILKNLHNSKIIKDD